jgi:hypothetical protein
MMPPGPGGGGAPGIPKGGGGIPDRGQIEARVSATSTYLESLALGVGILEQLAVTWDLPGLLPHRKT